MPHLIEQSPHVTASYRCSDPEYLGEEDDEGQVAPHQHLIANIIKEQKARTEALEGTASSIAVGQLVSDLLQASATEAPQTIQIIPPQLQETVDGGSIAPFQQSG